MIAVNKKVKITKYAGLASRRRLASAHSNIIMINATNAANIQPHSISQFMKYVPFPLRQAGALLNDSRFCLLTPSETGQEVSGGLIKMSTNNPTRPQATADAMIVIAPVV